MAKTSNKITANQLKKLEVGQAAYGSNLRVTRNKSGVTFHACFAIDGERYLHRLGTDETTNLTDAIREAAQIRAKKEREHELKREGGAESDMTLNEAVPMYFAELKNRDGRNIRSKEQHFRIHILPAFGEKKIQKISTDDVQLFLKATQDKGLQPATANRIKATLDHFFSHAIMKGWLHRKPYRAKNYAEQPTQRDRISSAHQEALLSAAKQPGQHPMIYLFLLIGLGVGMRHSEILNIRWENIDWETGYIWMPHTKTGAREQPTTDLIRVELRKVQQECGRTTGFVFASEKSKSGRIDRMHKPFQRVCKAAGVPAAYTPHFMRHTCVSELVAEGYSNHLVGHFTGHKTPAVISRYTHLKGTKAVAEVMRSRGCTQADASA